LDDILPGAATTIESAALSRAKWRLRKLVEDGRNDGDSNDSNDGDSNDSNDGDSSDIPVDDATAIATEGEGTMPVDVDGVVADGEMAEAGEDAMDRALPLPDSATKACRMDM
jgi:hypothetical protein